MAREKGADSSKIIMFSGAKAHNGGHMSYEQMQNNKVFLTGRVVSEPEFSHEMLGEGF